MKKLMIAVLFVSGLVLADGDATSHNANTNSNSNQTERTAPAVDRGSKLFEYYSACMLQRPSSSSTFDTEALLRQLSK